MHNRAKFDYTTLAPGYYDKVFARGKGVQSKWHHLKFARVRRELGLYHRHVDVGCGPGTFIGTLDAPGHSLGLDVAEPQIRYAQRVYGTRRRRFSLMQPGHLPVGDDAADVVTMIELIEHLTPEENRQLLAETMRILHPGGRLILTTPNYGALWPLLELLVNRLGDVRYEDQHISRFRRQSVRELVQSAGFHVQAAETYLLTAPFAAVLNWRVADWLERLEPAWLKRRFGHLLLVQAIKPERAAMRMSKAA